ncbi:MAG: VOC family protein [Nitrososphaerales archaeon]|nr:VOC family protein [Nitrososphaerales archaeon]
MAKPRRANRGRAIGMIAHTELASTDPEASKRFLGKIFGWEFETVKAPTGKLISYRTPGGARGSIRPTQPKEAPTSINYILVDDLDSTATRIKRMGGEIVLPRVDVPKMGSFFWFKVPGGPVLACWEDAPSRSENESA